VETRHKGSAFGGKIERFFREKSHTRQNARDDREESNPPFLP
jgi:hypothetical protein